MTSRPNDPAAGRPRRAGYDDLVATLLGAPVALPPVPVPFRRHLKRRGPWVWSTRPIDSMDMYMFRRYVEEALAGPVGDYLAISHAGHGVNSYGLNYHLVYGPLALFTQNGWGGGYMDPAESQARVAETFRLAAGLVASAESRHPAKREKSRVQLVVAFSDFRRVSWWRLCSTEPALDLWPASQRAEVGELSLDSLFAEAAASLRELLTPT